MQPNPEGNPRLRRPAPPSSRPAPQLERDRRGANVAYGLPQFLVRLVGWHRAPADLSSSVRRSRRD